MERPPIDRFDAVRVETGTDRDDVVSMALNGDVRWMDGDVTGARDAWAAAGDYYRLMAAAAFLRTKKNIPGAESMYRAAVHVRPASPEARLSVAAVQWDSGRVDAAAMTYERMIRDDPSGLGEVPYVNLATIYAQRAQYDSARAILTRGLAHWPRSIALRTTAAIVDAQSDRKELAVRTLNSVIGEDPKATDACYWLGWTYAHYGNDRDAARQFSKCLVRTPDDPRMLYDQGAALLRLHETKSARASFVRLLSISPDHRGAQDRLREMAEAIQ